MKFSQYLLVSTIVIACQISIIAHLGEGGWLRPQPLRHCMHAGLHGQSGAHGPDPGRCRARGHIPGRSHISPAQPCKITASLLLTKSFEN
jgi:hypothetical protein